MYILHYNYHGYNAVQVFANASSSSYYNLLKMEYYLNARETRECQEGRPTLRAARTIIA